MLLSSRRLLDPILIPSKPQQSFEILRASGRCPPHSLPDPRCLLQNIVSPRQADRSDLSRHMSISSLTHHHHRSSSSELLKKQTFLRSDRQPSEQDKKRRCVPRGPATSRKSCPPKLSKQGSTPTPWARVCETKSKKGAPDTENPSFVGFPVLRGGLRPWPQTMVSEGASPWGRGRSEFANKRP